MKQFLVAILLIGSFSAFARQGKVLESQKIKSTHLNKEVKYTVYLPPDYSVSERTYPIVYLLHGLGDDDTGWLQFGEVNRYADKAIMSGEIPPMVIVTPDGGKDFYINSYDGKIKYEDFFIKEFIPAVEKQFRIKAEKRYRAVAGLSMGGYGTLIYALKYPDLFSAAAPFSAGVFTDEELTAMPNDTYERVFAHLLGPGLEGDKRLNEHYQKNSVLKLIEGKSAEDLKKVRYWIDCGDDDFLTVGNAELHIALRKKQVPHEYRVREGAHNWTYWRTGLTDALAFIGESFRQK